MAPERCERHTDDGNRKQKHYVTESSFLFSYRNASAKTKNDVVQNIDTYNGTGFVQTSRYSDIFFAWAWITRGMVMYQKD